MRGGGIALTAALLLVAAWLFLAPASRSTDVQQPRQRPVENPSARLPKEARNGREFLSKAQVDQALATRTLDRPVESLLAVEKPMQFGDYHWNDRAIPAGPTWIRVDLGSQIISVFRSGHEIGTSVIVYGGDNKETPGGIFHILARDRDHRSSIYDAAMPYTLRLTGDGVSIHGSTVRWGAATHGCIGVPLEFARRLFEETRVGDEVVIVPVSRRVAASAAS